MMMMAPPVVVVLVSVMATVRTSKICSTYAPSGLHVPNIICTIKQRKATRHEEFYRNGFVTICMFCRFPVVSDRITPVPMITAVHCTPYIVNHVNNSA